MSIAKLKEPLLEFYNRKNSQTGANQKAKQQNMIDIDKHDRYEQHSSVILVFLN